MKTPLLTIFTPTYNRAHTLPRLFESLKAQTSYDFEWLVINDGSTDGTDALMQKWIKENLPFPIEYHSVTNGGKNKAINHALALAKGRYFMILDSDDILTLDAVEFSCGKMKEIESDGRFIGISGKRADMTTGKPIGFTHSAYSEKGFTDCSNLERVSYGLDRDMAEVFITAILKNYEFKVWPGEKFTPEEVVWNQIALDGYILRWYNKITYLCEYQQGGLSDSTWRLLRDNPMGYAMMWNHRLLFYNDSKNRRNAVIQYSICCILAKEWKELLKCNSQLLCLALLPVSTLLAFRRKNQIKRLCK